MQDVFELELPAWWGDIRLLSMLQEGPLYARIAAEVADLPGPTEVLTRARWGQNYDFIRVFPEHAAAASRVRHPGLVPVSAVRGLHESFVVVTQGARGRTLQDLTADGVAIDQILDIGIQVSSAIGALHDAGLVEMSVRPDQIFVQPEGSLRVLAVGAWRVDALTVDLEREPMGDIRLVAPEVIEGADIRDLNGSADVFVIGELLADLVLDRPLFETSGYARINEIRQPEKRVSSTHLGGRGDEICPGLGSLLTRCLRYDPAHRPSSGRALASELSALAR